MSASQRAQLGASEGGSGSHGPPSPAPNAITNITDELREVMLVFADTETIGRLRVASRAMNAAMNQWDKTLLDEEGGSVFTPAGTPPPLPPLQPHHPRLHHLPPPLRP